MDFPNEENAYSYLCYDNISGNFIVLVKCAIK